MIYQEMPRKGYNGCRYDENKGFYVEGKDYSDCLEQLKVWCQSHREKWVYYHDCGIGPGKPTPIARNVFEVCFYDMEPAALMWSFRLFQRGSEGKREIDSMTAEEKKELMIKQGTFFAMLGSSFRKGRESK